LEDFELRICGTYHEKSFPMLTGMQKMDVWFEPEIVIEVSASEITLSPLHTAGMNSIREKYGLALRFPKFTGKVRIDKKPEDATTVDELVSMYKWQMRAVKVEEREKHQ
jgi:DNA ligase-1